MPDFHPSRAQRQLLDWVRDHPGCRSIQELCRNSGTPRSTYYSWYRDDAFRHWFTAAWSSLLLIDGLPLINQARALAPESFRYWKALFDLIFDPKGLAMLQHWQAALAASCPAPRIPSNSVQEENQQNPALACVSLDKNPASDPPRRRPHAPARPTPRNHIRWLQNSLAALHHAGIAPFAQRANGGSLEEP